MGRFEVANGGTLFLDEIGELPLALQTKLLRMLQDGQFERLGSSQTISVDVRVIAVTNRDLEEGVGSGRFRKDLYYRLQVFPITVPPLRDRREDIPLLVRAFVEKFARKSGKTIDTVAAEAMEALQRYPWPGNVRELQNVIERAVINTRGPGLRLMDTLAEPGVSGLGFGKLPTPDACRVRSRVHRAGPRGDRLADRGGRGGRQRPWASLPAPCANACKSMEFTGPKNPETEEMVSRLDL